MDEIRVPLRPALLVSVRLEMATAQRGGERRGAYRHRWAMQMRKSLEDTWRYLQSEGEEAPRRPDGRPFVPDAMPSFDDEQLGLRYFRTLLWDADNSNLTMPRTFFGHCEFRAG